MKILDVPRSGSYQGITSSRNRFGQYVRTRATPVNPNSSFQAAVRARLATNAASWRATTAIEKEGWQSLGEQIQRTDSLGQYYTLNGFMAFCLINNNKAAAGDALVTTAPALVTPDAIETITPTVTASTMSVAFTVTPLAAGERLFLSASPPRSPGRIYEADLRLVVVTAAAGTSPINAFAAWSARFGAPVAGQKVFFAAQRYSGGWLSTPILSSAIVT